MAGRNKKNPLHYDLTRLREDRFEARSLKRYKKKFPREREISKWFPWADIFMVGMDLYDKRIDEQAFPIRLQPRLEDHRFRKDIGLLNRYWLQYERLPQASELDLLDPNEALALFCQFCTWDRQALTSFSMSESLYSRIKDHLISEGLSLEAQELIFPQFDAVYLEREKDPQSLVVGLAPTSGLNEQLTPSLLLHELTEFIINLKGQDGTGIYERIKHLGFFNFLEIDGSLALSPKFLNDRLYGKYLMSYSSRDEMLHLLLELYWKRGRLFSREDFLKISEIPRDIEGAIERYQHERAEFRKTTTDIGQRLLNDVHIAKKLGISQKWAEEGIPDPTEEEIEAMISEVNVLVKALTEDLLMIKEPIFMRL